MLKTKQPYLVNYKLKIIGLLLLPSLCLISCTDYSNKFEEHEVVLAFAEAKLYPDDRIYFKYRENIDIYERALYLPFSGEGIQSSFKWHNNQSIIEFVKSGDISRFNNQIENYEPGIITDSENDSLFVNEFNGQEGYFDGDEFIGVPMNGKTYILSRPIIGRSFALIFYDLSPGVNSLSGGSIMFQLKEGKLVKVAENTIVATP